MQRQAVPTISKETAIIQTGYEKQVIKNSESTIIAKKSGEVLFVNSKKIIILEENTNDLLINMEKYYEKKQKGIKKGKTLDKKLKKRIYKLEKSKKSNQNTYIAQEPVVKKNEWVKKGQIIAENTTTINGKLALGKNLLIGYMTWEGYNFEDAIVISQKILENEIFTSIHIKKYKTFLIKDKTGDVRMKIIKKK